MITAQQIRAARAWIDWSQDALAEKSGVSRTTIRSLEGGKISPRSVEGVRLALEDRGFRFHGANGLSLHADENRIYEGAGSCDAFYDDLLSTTQNKGGEVAAVFRTQDQFARSLGVCDAASLKRFAQLVKVAVVKCLLSDARHLPLAIPAVQFRATMQSAFGGFGTFVYGDRVAVVVTNGADFIFHVMKSLVISRNSRNDFAACWEAALPLTVQAAPAQKRA